ncbi:hypothetical protein DFH27DRAFT_553813 [Peziza echinospora]|nr:hypothetical protein DFH27DRAFT_553813 [Peziza echinospora]
MALPTPHPEPTPGSHETTADRRDRSETADRAAKAAIWGGVVGVAKGSIIATLLGIGLHLTSPVFRGLTPQFKVYLFMCPMTVGGMVGADRRLREYEARVRWERREMVRRREAEEMEMEME